MPTYLHIFLILAFVNSLLAAPISVKIGAEGQEVEQSMRTHPQAEPEVTLRKWNDLTAPKPVTNPTPLPNAPKPPYDISTQVSPHIGGPAPGTWPNNFKPTSANNVVVPPLSSVSMSAPGRTTVPIGFDGTLKLKVLNTCSNMEVTVNGNVVMSWPRPDTTSNFPMICKGGAVGASMYQQDPGPPINWGPTTTSCDTGISENDKVEMIVTGPCRNAANLTASGPLAP